MIKKLTAVAADIDGTLMPKGEKMMPVTRQAIQKLHVDGIWFGLATGRAISTGLFKRADDWDLGFAFDFLIGINGSQLWDKNHQEVQNFHQLSCSTLKDIIEMMEPLELPVSMYEGDGMVTTEVDDLMAQSMRRNHTEMIDTHGDLARMYVHPNNNLIYRYHPDQEKEVLEHIASHPSDFYVPVRTAPGIVEFMDPRVNKGVGLQKLSENNDIPMAEIMAFGDMDNDAEMLKTAGWGVCLLNGSKKSKSCADAITEFPCWEDGTGRYLMEHWYMQA